MFRTSGTPRMPWVNSISDASIAVCVWQGDWFLSKSASRYTGQALDTWILDPKSKYHLCHQSQTPSSSLSFPSSWQCHHPRLDPATLPTSVETFVFARLHPVPFQRPRKRFGWAGSLRHAKFRKTGRHSVHVNGAVWNDYRYTSTRRKTRWMTSKPRSPLRASHWIRYRSNSNRLNRLSKGSRAAKRHWWVDHKSWKSCKYLHIISDLKEFAWLFCLFLPFACKLSLGFTPPDMLCVSILASHHTSFNFFSFFLATNCSPPSHKCLISKPRRLNDKWHILYGPRGP